jgi:hypothetical protein
MTDGSGLALPPSNYPDDPTPIDYGTLDDDVMISGKGADPTHHIKLTDGEGSSVGFVITDQAGDLDERTFRRFPSADPQNPYITEKQEGFGGGFGQRVFEENRSKYWRSKGVDTTKDAVVLAPMFHYARGVHSKAREYMPDSAHTMGWYKVKGSFAWLAMPFTPDQEWTKTEYLKLWVKKSGTPSSLRIRTYTDSADAPFTLIHSQDVAHTSITHTDGEWIRIDIDDTYTYGAATKFWIVLTTTGSGSGTWRVLGTNSGSGGKKSTGGSSWTNGPEFYFRIEGNRQDAKHTFIDYKKQLYFVAHYDTYGASRLFMNGWRGVADSNAANKLRLYDSNYDWSTTDWITGDEVAQVYAGPASAEQEDRRFVASGANGYLTMDRTWQITHGTRDEYVITNSDWFFEVSASGNLTGRVSDLATGAGLMYFCKGNNRYMTALEEYRNSSGDWTNRWVTVYTKAHYVKSVNDPVLGNILWFGHNQSLAGAYKPYVWYSVPVDGDGMNVTDIAHLSSNAGGGATWVAAGGAQVSVDELKGSAVRITVTIGEVTGASVNAQGTGYSVNDKLTITNPDGTDTMQLNVDTIGGGGEVTAVSIDDGGTDFDVATGQATTGGGGSGCTIDLDTVSTFTGDIAYLDLKDVDGSAITVDLRNMTRISSYLRFNTVFGVPNELAAGDLKIKISDQVALGNVISTASFVGLSAGYPHRRRTTFATLALSNVAGSGAVASIGISLDAAHSLDRSFRFMLAGEWTARRDRSLVEVGFLDGDNITGLQAYGDPETAWVFTEAGFGMIKNNKFLPVPMREILVARHANNGIGNEVSDVYLLLTWKGRLQRYYRQNMEDLGPDFPEGMSDIQGEVVDVVTYPGRIYAAIDGGTGGSSMILCHKGGGWHEVYTSFTGERIRKLHIQPIEGKPDKLWASVGGDVMWFPIILDSAELPANSGYTYVPMGYLDTSWIYSGDRDLNKVFRSLWATLDKAKDADLFVNIYYKVDNEDDDWKLLKDVRTHTYSTVEYPLLVENSPEPRGNRVKFRIHLRTRDNASSSVVRSIQTRMYRLPEIKYIYTWLSKVSSISVNLRGDEERVLGTQSTAEAGMNKLDKWASDLAILTTESDIAAANGRTVVIEPVPFQLLMMVHDEGFQEESIQMSANEV